MAGIAAAPSDGSMPTETVVITGIAAGGAGVARLADGRVAFIHGTAPGDHVDSRVTQQHRRWVRARTVRLIQAGPDRRPSPCPFDAVCGGCTLQHIAIAAQRREKAALVREAMRRIGGIEIDVPDVVESLSEFEYRNRVTFHLRRLGAERVVAGFHELERADRLVDVDGRCLLPEPTIRTAWRDLRREWGRNAHRLPAGESLRITLQSAGSGEVGLLTEGGYGDGRPDEIIERVPSITAVWKMDADGRVTHLAGRRALGEAEDASLPAGVFTQVNRAVADRLGEHVDDLLGEVAGRHIIDAYCGIAIRAIRWAAAGARVSGIEADERAAAEARRRCDGQCDIVHGLVEDHMADLLPADIVILNPPRAGVHERVVRALIDRPPGRLLYVSCDPATLARDCARLAERYTIRDVRCFDMFPQTAHIETVVDLRCATS
jgi:23S rRNA (uracil1939-C5)-methyltransferase